MDLLGLPASPELGTSQNGVSLRAAFEQPHANHSAAKPFAYSQYPRCGAGPPPPLVLPDAQHLRERASSGVGDQGLVCCARERRAQFMCLAHTALCVHRAVRRPAAGGEWRLPHGARRELFHDGALD